MENKLAQIFGTVNAPPGVNRYSSPTNFISNIVKLLIVGAGIYALFNIVTAGYSFMSAGGDPKKIADAWSKIWLTLVGLLFAAGSIILAAIFGRIIFGDANALLQITIFEPN
ncbi:hypothetical protein A2V80_03425 [Candidatus Woesebacteria bacterium RBG_16_39_8b]|uniref:Uncharacterized protein n=1 Tax=Candidatus Woesebacteria bacterium RBG_16_39_8b TaxID=1802482 RepID=A0A1F7XDP9_9BACT|nr:MAG: hypothetical protein A2V80_03425 [Candidatus Woesebacteria bacterium RBG_16_39_8b]